MPVSVDRWYEGVESEVGFWQDYINTKGARWAEDYRDRLDPGRPFNGFVEEAIRDTGLREIEVLDVGAGPITGLGYVSKKFDIRITAVDPLADAYAVLLKEAGVTPPVRTEMCFGENLLQHFGSRRFHVCHSSNALDHSIDPRTILHQMIQLLHPNGLLLVRMFKNEGQSGGYEGLHNWNFDIDQENNFILWRPAEMYKINEELSEFVDGQATERVVGDRVEVHFTAYRKAA